MSARLLAFCFRSLFREYGAGFLLRVALLHPLATGRGIARYVRGRPGALSAWQGGPGSLVGLGFCLKPLVPACPSGRANHDCQFFESVRGADLAPCADCRVRTIGEQALLGGSTLYVMTSARDILHDVLLPALRRRRFRSAVLAMCRYSFEPMRLALAICGIDAQLVPFVEGDCRDYSAWRRADMGQKPEQTVLDEAGSRKLSEILSGAAQCMPPRQYHRSGNVYEPV